MIKDFEANLDGFGAEYIHSNPVHFEFQIKQIMGQEMETAFKSVEKSVMRVARDRIADLKYLSRQYINKYLGGVSEDKAIKRLEEIIFNKDDSLFHLSSQLKMSIMSQVKGDKNSTECTYQYASQVSNILNVFSKYYNKLKSLSPNWTPDEKREMSAAMDLLDRINVEMEKKRKNFKGGDPLEDLKESMINDSMSTEERKLYQASYRDIFNGFYGKGSSLSALEKKIGIHAAIGFLRQMDVAENLNKFFQGIGAESIGAVDSRIMRADVSFGVVSTSSGNRRLAVNVKSFAKPYFQELVARPIEDDLKSVSSDAHTRWMYLNRNVTALDAFIAQDYYAKVKRKKSTIHPVPDLTITRASLENFAVKLSQMYNLASSIDGFIKVKSREPVVPFVKDERIEFDHGENYYNSIILAMSDKVVWTHRVLEKMLKEIIGKENPTLVDKKPGAKIAKDSSALDVYSKIKEPAKMQSAQLEQLYKRKMAAIRKDANSYASIYSSADVQLVMGNFSSFKTFNYVERNYYLINPYKK